MKPHIIIPCATSRDRSAVAKIQRSAGGGDYCWQLLPANYHSAQNRWETSVGAEVCRVNHVIDALRKQTRGLVPIGIVPTMDFGTMVAGIAAAALLGLLMALPTAKLQQDYWAISTLAVAEIIRLVFLNTPLGGSYATDAERLTDI